MRAIARLVLLWISSAVLSGCAGSGPFKVPFNPEPVVKTTEGSFNVAEFPGANAGQKQCEDGQMLSATVKMADADQLKLFAHCASFCDANMQAIIEKGKKKIGTVCGENLNPWMQKLAFQSFKMVRANCQAFFNRLERERVEIQYNQNNANVAVGAIAALLSAGAGHTRAVLNLTSGATVGNAFTENYKAAFIFTPELGKLHDKIKSELLDVREAEISQNLKNGSYATYADLIADLADYEDLCSHKTIQKLVSSMPDLTKFVFSNQEISVETRKMVAAIEDGLAKKQGLGEKSEQSWQALAALAELEMADRKKVISFLKTKSGEKTNAELIDGDGNVFGNLLKDVEKLKLDSSDENIRELRRITDNMKWGDSADFKYMVTLMQNYALRDKPASDAAPTATSGGTANTSGGGNRAPASTKANALANVKAASGDAATASTALAAKSAPKADAADTRQALVFSKIIRSSSMLRNSQPTVISNGK